MKRAKKQESYEAAARKRLMDERSAQLRLRVEEIARQHTSAAQNTTAEAGDMSLKERPSRLSREDGGLQIPMLISSTEMGVYIKWALTLQEQLAHVTESHSQAMTLLEQLREENRVLRGALGQQMLQQPAVGMVPSTMSVVGSQFFPECAILPSMAGAYPVGAAPAPAAAPASAPTVDMFDAFARRAPSAAPRPSSESTTTETSTATALPPLERMPALVSGAASGALDGHDEDLLEALLATPTMGKHEISTPNLEMLARQLDPPDPSPSDFNNWGGDQRLTRDPSVSSQASARVERSARASVFRDATT